MIITHTRPV